MTIGLLDLMKQEAKGWASTNPAEGAPVVPPPLVEDGAIGQHSGQRLAVDDPHLSIPQANDQQFAKDAEKKSRPAPNAVKQSPPPSGWDPQGAGYTHTTPLPVGATTLKPANGQVPAEMGTGKAPTAPTQDTDKSLAAMLQDFDKAVLGDDTLANPLFNGPDAHWPLAVAPVAIQTIPVESAQRRGNGIPLPGARPRRAAVSERGAIPLPPARTSAAAGGVPTSISEAIARVRGGESAKTVARRLRVSC